MIPDFQTLFEAAPALNLVLTPDLTIVAVTEAYLEATMTRRKEIIGKYIFDVFPDDPADKEATGVSNLHQSLNYVLQNHLAHTMAIQKYDIRNRDGNFEERYWSPVNKPVLDSDNQLRYIIHRVEDVTGYVKLKMEEEHKNQLTEALRSRIYETEIEVYKRTVEVQEINRKLVNEIAERKQAEERIKVAYDHIKDLYNGAPCGYHSVDNKGFFIEINDTELQWLGYEREAVIGKMKFNDLLTAEGIETSKSNLEKFKTEGKVENLLFEMRRKNGELFWVTVNATAIYNEQGEFIHSRTAVHDVTEVKKSEEAIKALNDELQVRIAQLEEINNEMKTFTYSVSHDLRAPLRAISGFSTLMMEEYGNELNDECKRMLGVLDVNAKKMGRLIDDLIDYSRVGRTELSVKNVDIMALANDVIKELKVSYEDVDIEFSMGEPKQIECDSLLMKQALQNLIGNAIKYSSRKPKALVQFNWFNKDEETIFYVKDNGAGFDMKYSAKLFAMFQRLHSPSQFDGSGVGLAIVKRIIKKHGGKIWAEGAINEGATFYFSIPDKISHDYDFN